MRLKQDPLEWREVDGEVVALDVAAAEYLAANPAGAVVWRLLADGASHEELVQALVARFDVDEATAAGDAEAFVATLRERGLLEE